MLPVEFKKRPCRPVEFKGQGPLIWPKLSFFVSIENQLKMSRLII